MAKITGITNDAWSASVTLTTAEFWQVRAGPVLIATDAASEPASADDGILLDTGDVIELANGDVVRYRGSRAEDDAVIVRRAKA